MKKLKSLIPLSLFFAINIFPLKVNSHHFETFQECENWSKDCLKTKERKGLVWYPVIDHGDCIEGDSGYHRYSKIKIDGRRRMVLCSQ